jgi:hypothetical protein
LEIVHGRGAAGNPGNRFERTEYAVSEWDEPEDPARTTIFLKDATRSIITYNESPDVGFDASINPLPRLRTWLHLLLCPAQPRIIWGFLPPRILNPAFLVKEDAPEL